MIKKNNSVGKTVSHILQTGHCAQAMIYNNRALLNAADYQYALKSLSGFAEGLGYQGAVCGGVVGGALSMSLLDRTDHLVLHENEMGKVLRIRHFVKSFQKAFGSSLCRDIAGVDFGNNWQVRKQALVGVYKCIHVTSKAAGLMAQSLNSHEMDDDCPDYLQDVHHGFLCNEIRCARSVIASIFGDDSDAAAYLKTKLAPLNGGIGYCGSTCSALMGGAMAIGLIFGDDAGKGGMGETVYRTLKVVVKGRSAYKKSSYSPTNEALMRCSELYERFEEKFGAHLCRDITHTDFSERDQAERFFTGRVFETCRIVCDETAKMVREVCKL